MNDSDLLLEIIRNGGLSALNLSGPEDAIEKLVEQFFDVLGDRFADKKPGSLKPGERQYFVAGAFIVSPDQKHHMLIANRGFPAEQRRLLVPIDAGNPGWVWKNRKPLLLENTDQHAEFRQYLKTSRMGSAIFTPMVWKGEFLGQVIMAAQARYTMRQCDLDGLTAISRLASALWIAHSGPAWLAQEYPPKDAFYVGSEGVE